MVSEEKVLACLKKCEQALSHAEVLYVDGKNAEQEYYDIQRYLEEIAIEVEQLSDYSTAKERDQLYKARLNIQQMQNKLLLKNIDTEEWSMNI